MPHIKSVSVAFFVRAGGCYELESQAGISHFIEHICFKGTSLRPCSREITELIEGTGGSINAGTDKELTVFWCKVASQHLYLAIDVLNDMLRNSKMEDVDIEKERSVIIEEINMNHDLPQQRADNLIYELLWPNQSLGHDIAGNKETVSSFLKRDLTDYYNSHYAAENIVVSIAGDISQDVLDDVTARLFSTWHSGTLSTRINSVSQQQVPQIRVDYREIEQVHLCFGFHGLSLTHPDRFAVDLFNIILGDGMSSRLFMELREQRGLAYEIGSSVDHFHDAGDLIIHAGVDNKKVEESINVILNELFTLCENMKEYELVRAKEIIKGRILLAMENTRSVSNWLGAQELLNNNILDIDEVTALVEKVTLKDIFRITESLFSPVKMNLAVVGPFKKIEQIHGLLKHFE